MKYYKYVLPFKPEKIENSDWVYLGREIITPAEFDEEGNLITDTVYSENHKVDVIWRTEINKDWDEWIVKPTNHEHWFAGMQYLWEESNNN